MPCENFILSRYDEVLSDIEYFKAFHHGRNDENSTTWVNRIAPRATVIPIAFSAYNEGWQGGYDSSVKVLQRLAAVGSDVFRFGDAEPVTGETDPGTFWHTTFVTDGASFEVRIEPSIW